MLPLVIVATLVTSTLVLMLTGFVYQRISGRGVVDTGQRVSKGRVQQAYVPDNANPWQQYWGEPYGLQLKQRLLSPVFESLESENKIGDLIVDVGSGAVPVTQLLETRPARKRICVDLAADNVALSNVLRIRFDAENVGQFRALSFKKAILRVCAFLDINPRTEVNAECADTIVCSDLLNYVDYEKVLKGFANFLKPDGRIIVVNSPIRGNRSLFSEKGLRDNRQLDAFLEEHHFEIEHKAFPKRPRKETNESEELVVLVARKCAAPIPKWIRLRRVSPFTNCEQEA
jgi:SAM-dependent methyltransferase